MGSHTYLSADRLCPSRATLLAGVKRWMGILQEPQYLSPAHCVPFINIDAFLSPAEIWLPGLIITLVVRILAHELASLLGTVSHSFQVVPGVEASLCRRRGAIFQVSSSLSSSLSKHQLPRRPGNVREKSPCQIPRISLSHYVTLYKVTYVLRVLVSLF